MRNKLLILFLLLSLISKSQTRWFKHLPGWLAINSLTFSDTILTSGMNNIVKSFGNKNGIFICWYNLVGDSIDQFNINLDSIYKDSLKSTEISYINNLSISNYFGYQLLISVRNGLLDNNSFLMTFDKFHTYNYKLEEIKVDTFVTFINNKIRVGKSNIYFLNFLDSKSNIYKTVIWNSSKISIKEYHDFKIEKYENNSHVADLYSNNSFFFKFIKMWDFSGNAEQWEEFIIKMDTLGNEMWRSQPNNRDSINPEGMQFVQKPNGNLLVSWCDEKYRPYRALPPNDGSHLSQPNKYCTVWFAEIDSNGKILWRKNIRKYLNYKLQRNHDHNLDHVKAIPVKDGVIWVGRSAWIYWHNYILKTDYNGNPLWYREYELYPKNTAKSEFLPYDITATKDGGFVVTGEYRSANGNIFPNGCQLATIIKIDSFGCLEPGCQKGDSIPSKIREIKKTICKVYPNPANEAVTIQLPFNKKGIYLLEIFSMTGKLIEKIAIHESTELNTAKYNSGFYLFKLYNEQSYETHKISILH